MLWRTHLCTYSTILILVMNYPDVDHIIMSEWNRSKQVKSVSLYRVCLSCLSIRCLLRVLRVTDELFLFSNAIIMLQFCSIARKLSEYIQFKRLEEKLNHTFIYLIYI